MLLLTVALALTVVYILLTVLAPPLAAGAGAFYLAAVLVLVICHRWKIRRGS